MHFTICRKARIISFAPLFVAFILFNAQPSHAGDQPQLSSQFRANSRLVVVDVVITDAAGRVVHGLKTQDFKVMEDGKAQVIIGFEEHGSDTGPKPKPAIPNLLKNEYTNYVTRNDPGALNVLLLDTLNSSHQDLASARSEMLSFLLVRIRCTATTENYRQRWPSQKRQS